MAGSAGSIYVDLLLRDSNYREGWNRARGYTKQGASQISGDVNKIGQSFTGVINPVNNLGAALRNLSGVIAGAFSVQKIIQYNDTWTQLEGRLSLVTSSMGDLASVQQELFDIAQRSRQPVEGVYNLYTRLAQAIPEAQRSQYDLLGVTESINQALAITGEGSAQASSAILQFTQAVASGFKGSGQEINALLDSAPRLARALQNSFGDGQKSLKQLAADGELDLDRILKALAGTGEEGRKLREEFAKIPPTVGQAFTQLDNAFLQFIGQSQAVQAGTSSLVTVIQALAKNLDVVANAAIILAGVFAGKLVASFVAANGQALAYQLALGRMAGLNAVATTSILGLSGALRGLSLAWAAIGGPIGVAVIGAISLLTLQSDYAADAQKRLNDEVQNFSSEASKYAQASDELKNKIRQDTQDRIKEYEKELLAIQELYKAYNDQGFFGKFLDNLGSSARRTFGLGGGEGIRDIVGEGAALENSIQRLRELQDSYEGIDNSTAVSSTNTEKATKSIEKWLIKQREALETLRQEADYIGKTKIETDLLKDAREFEAQVAERSYGLKGRELERFREQAEAIKILRQEVIQYNYEASRTAQAGFEEFSSKYQEDATNMAKNVQDVLENAFKGAEDAFVEFTKTGKLNFRDLANSIIEDLIRIQFKKSVSGLLGGLGGGSGGLGGLFGNIFGSQGGIARLLKTGNADFIGPLPEFADGGYLGPGQFGIAGEAGAELLYGGKTGVSVFNQDQIGGRGTVYQIDARGTDPSVVRRIEQSLMALAGPGVIEQRVYRAQSRGAL